ncbi:MAG TPA: isoprenylcysteine carboxylmethyltransferase family protein [Terracidiphilus sp.]|nr:isoprenylcysteine carboxylmethyltransferase family protein [Terracidiphilus sp.]
MSGPDTPQRAGSGQHRDAASQPAAGGVERWQRVARRIRVPLGFVTAALYLFELWRRAPQPVAIAGSLALVLPGLWLRGYAAGYVKKNREITMTGPYAHTRNPLYLGSMLMAAGFAVALESWAMAAVLAAGFAFIYIPVIASEERFLRAAFPEFDAYCRSVPRMIPRLTPARSRNAAVQDPAQDPGPAAAGFSLDRYLKHREYNAAIGAALLYLSLLFLRPALSVLLHGIR